MYGWFARVPRSRAALWLRCGARRALRHLRTSSRLELCRRHRTCYRLPKSSAAPSIRPARNVLRARSWQLGTVRPLPSLAAAATAYTANCRRTTALAHAMIVGVRTRFRRPHQMSCKRTRRPSIGRASSTRLPPPLPHDHGHAFCAPGSNSGSPLQTAGHGGACAVVLARSPTLGRGSSYLFASAGGSAGNFADWHAALRPALRARCHRCRRCP